METSHQHLLRDVTHAGAAAEDWQGSRRSRRGTLKPEFDMSPQKLPTSGPSLHRGMVMALKKVPTNTWMVMDGSRYGPRVVSTHASRREAEVERDTCNTLLGRPRFSVCIAFEPVAEGMGQSCR